MFTEDKEEHIYPKVNAHFEEVKSFIAAVEGEKASLRSPYSDAIKTLEVTLAASESARRGEPIRL